MASFIDLHRALDTAEREARLAARAFVRQRPGVAYPYRVRLHAGYGVGSLGRAYGLGLPAQHNLSAHQVLHWTQAAQRVETAMTGLEQALSDLQGALESLPLFAHTQAPLFGLHASLHDASTRGMFTLSMQPLGHTTLQAHSALSSRYRHRILVGARTSLYNPDMLRKIISGLRNLPAGSAAVALLDTPPQGLSRWVVGCTATDSDATVSITVDATTAEHALRFVVGTALPGLARVGTPVFVHAVHPDSTTLHARLFGTPRKAS